MSFICRLSLENWARTGRHRLSEEMVAAMLVSVVRAVTRREATESTLVELVLTSLSTRVTWTGEVQLQVANVNFEVHVFKVY